MAKNIGGTFITKVQKNVTQKSLFSKCRGMKSTSLVKNVVEATFGRNVTPIIFCHLYKKISFSEVNGEFFYKQPVFTGICVVSKNSTDLGAQSSKFAKMLQIHPNRNAENDFEIEADRKKLAFTSKFRIRVGLPRPLGWPQSKKYCAWSITSMSKVN